MMEYTLEDDIPELFKGGTLQLNTDDKLTPEKTTPEKLTPGQLTPNQVTAGQLIAGEIKEDNLNSVNGNTNLYDAVKPQKSVDNSYDADKNSLNVEINNSLWKSNIMIPLSGLTDCIWSKRCISPNDKSTDVQPTFASLVQENANNFFIVRNGVLDNAVKECAEQLLDSEADGPLLNVFLLTEIHSWDTDKERLVLLTPNSIVIVKYDFIALKRIECRKIFLKEVDSMLIGDLVYPSKSLIPRIHGIADGVSSVVQNCLFHSWSKNDKGMYDMFQSRNRNMYGIRLMWNKNQPITFGTKWNPFSSKIPFATFTSHPLFFHKDMNNEGQKKLYDVSEFVEAVCAVVTELDTRKIHEPPCIIHHKEILLENYFSIGSIIHNRNALGYFKVRGKFSF